MKASNERKREFYLLKVVTFSIVICGSGTSAEENGIVTKVKKWALNV
jgi:hypothetical protein